MSSRQRKRRGGAVGSTRARKRSRLLPSSAGGTSQAELIDLEGSGTLAFEPAGEEIIDLTGESSEPEVIITSDDESDVAREQRLQQPHLSTASENSAEPLARDDEEEPRENDGSRPASVHSSPRWLPENSRDWEESQEDSLGSISSDSSSQPLPSFLHLYRRNNEVEPAGGLVSPPTRDDDNPEDWEESQEDSLGSISSDSSSQPLPSFLHLYRRNNEVSSNSSEWLDRFESPPNSQDDITDDWEESQEDSLGSISSDSSSQPLPGFLHLEPIDIEFEPAGGLVSPPTRDDDNPELLQGHEQQRRSVTPNSHERVDGSGNGTGANSAPVADAASAEQGAEQEDTASSAAQQRLVVKCPICRDDYFEIMERGVQLVATMCGHVFCDECLTTALDNTYLCPVCRGDLSYFYERYIYIYL